jgi:hypothetical protein
MKTKKKYRPITHGVLSADDQALYADFQQDCEAKRRWHRVPPQYVGRLISGLRKQYPHVQYRRLA